MSTPEILFKFQITDGFSADADACLIMGKENHRAFAAAIEAKTPPIEQVMCE